MTSSDPVTLKWSGQFTLATKPNSKALQGDKIVLPPSALEQLLSAATVTVVSDQWSTNSTFDPFNPYTFTNDNRPTVLERHQNLPHPLTFRLVNSKNGNVAYAGIREFSADDDEVEVSNFLETVLGTDRHDEEAILTIHAQQLSKGTYVRLRPLEAGYDPEDWRALLERYMRNTFTTLMKGEILTILGGGQEEYRFLIDKLLPEQDAICIVDTDLEVDIEALDEEQARESLKRRLEKTQKVAGSPTGSLSGGDVTVGQQIKGQVLHGSYVDYTLKDWDRSKALEIELDGSSVESLDLFVSPFTSRQRQKPRQDEHVFGDTTRFKKRIKLQHTNAELDGAEALFISAYGYKEDGNTMSDSPIQFSLAIHEGEMELFTSEDQVRQNEKGPTDPDDVRCKNCFQWVPKGRIVLHESFCYRNNVACARCKAVFQRSSTEWKNHWHCEYDDAHGNSSQSHQKHDKQMHTPQLCSACGYQTKSVIELARHRTSTCPEKIILCQFCHLLVPQQGPDDLDPNDPEVILSGLTPHELSDGSRTTECHLCGKFVRLRDMRIHLRHHDMERLSRITPRLCRNMNCGRTLDGVGPRGEIKRPQETSNDIGLCDKCFGPLYNSAYDPDHKALKRRVERRYLGQFLTGCGNDFCRNESCKIARQYLGLGDVSSKEAIVFTKPILANLMDFSQQLHFCTDESSQKRRLLAEMLAAEDDDTEKHGYHLQWTVAALEAESGDLGKARAWLDNWAPTKVELAR